MSLVQHLGLPVRSQQKGEVGIEIEVEGSNLPREGEVPPEWRVEVDNSLRGESAEYVLSKPVARDKVKGALDGLKGAYKSRNTKASKSFRAGVHVHINVQGMTPRQLMNFATLYFMYEYPLVAFCGETRKGNHFCLRSGDASYLMELLSEAVRDGNLRILNTDNIRYASINFVSLFKYGSLEFRAMESTDDFSRIEAWANLLLCLKDKAMELSDPTQCIGDLSAEGFVEFSKFVFGDNYPVIERFLNEEEIYKGIHNVQHTAYSRDWSVVKNLNIFKVSEDVFSS